MNWTEKCSSCAKSNHLINMGYHFACLDDKCEYEPFTVGEVSYTKGILMYSSEGEITLFKQLEGNN